MTIKTDIDIPVTADDMRLEAARPEALELFNLYGFNSLKKYLGVTASAGGGIPPEGRATRGTEAGGPSAIADGGVSPQDELPQGVYRHLRKP